MTERVPCPACVTVDPVSAYGLPRETPPTYLFACPECGAAPGVSCVDEVGTRTFMAPWYRHRAEPHDARRKACPVCAGRGTCTEAEAATAFLERGALDAPENG